MKFFFVLLFSVLLTVSIGTAVKNYRTEKKEVLVSPLVAGESTSVSSTPPNVTNSSMTGWQIFVNNYYGYKVKHPSDVSIKNKSDGDVSLQKTKSINILITQGVVTENETLNTVIEKVIELKKNDLKDKYILSSTISPIAIGSMTAQTYTAIEREQSITYYFIPQKNSRYLLVANYSPHENNSDFLISENIVYSLELLP